MVPCSSSIAGISTPFIYKQPAGNLQTVCMESKRRTQAERSATTRAALIAAARRQFAAHGYAAVGTPAIAAEAGVTRGAMYHQFADKAALFSAVAEAVERDLTLRLDREVTDSDAPHPLAMFHVAVDTWLEACTEPEVRQILLLDAPAVLGWAAYRDLTVANALGLTEALLSAVIRQGQIPEQPARPLAHVLIGALDEAALYVATAEDGATARAEVARVLHALVDALASRP